GIRAAQGEILVLVDSDTRWTPGLLGNVQKPFVDPHVGGVSTQQNVYQRTSSLWRRIADWLVTLRYLDYVPAQGRFGAVACLSGRTAAYRASGSCRWSRTWRTSSSSGGAASPATTDASPGWSSPRGTARCTSARRRRCPCSPRRSRPS